MPFIFSTLLFIYKRIFSVFCFTKSELNEFVKTNLSSGGDLAIDDTFDLIASCVDQVYSEEESWAASDCTKKE